METLKKRIGHPRDTARSVLDKFFSVNPPFRLPIPVQQIAEYYGFEVYNLDSMSNHQRAIKQEFPEENRRLIGVNARFHKHNQRFSIGHELGHHFMGHLPEDQCDDEEIKICNQEADEFSAELLMPLNILKEELSLKKDVRMVARTFEVSEEATWRKILAQRLTKLL